MRESSPSVQALRDKAADSAGSERSKPKPPPMRVIDKGIFGFRQVKPAAERKAG